MQRIAFFTPSLQIGGVERVFITYAHALLDLGYDVSYVICKDGGVLSSALPPNLRVVSLGNHKLRNSIVSLYRYFRKSPVDVFITATEIPNSLCVILSKLARSKTKVIVSHHNYFNVERNDTISKFLIRFVYNKASKVLSVSNGITQMLLECGVRCEKIATIYNPIDVLGIKKYAGFDSDIALPSKYLLFIGRLGEVKNLPFLIDSFSLVIQNDPTLELLFLGEGPMRMQLEEKTKNLGLEHIIHFLSAVSNPYPIIKNASAVVLPSFSEALPTVILECFTLGKTMIASPTNGALDLFEKGHLGYISHSFDDAKEFAATIEKGLLDPIPADILKAKVKDFDIEFKILELVKIL
jgi:glycosyltransferase involved in cell wall biosynthesis